VGESDALSRRSGSPHVHGCTDFNPIGTACISGR
jgi:hypothetical protein